MVAYKSLGTNNGANGAVCMAAVQSTGTAMGSDFEDSYLIHVPTTTWSPPAISGNVSPTSLALSDAKYAITTSPATTKYIFTGGFYTSVTWYQPKYASTYSDIERYGKDDHIDSYCF